ncbi:hypothetical protein EZS27_026235 [termite gut metagenome]|uniref:Uncharacterized protein n=1 Tax=termite gut metagenome TaxID=433724 RepID=A0A5J4QUH5_9ZZZZ
MYEGYSMKRTLEVIFAIIFFASCEKEGGLPENPMNSQPIRFFPNMSEANTREGDYYSWDDYYKICPKATVYMTVDEQTSTATYKYNDTNKLLEYEEGTPLYYPTNSKPYQIIVLWPVKSIQELYGETDYQGQGNFESYLRSDQLSDTINSPERTISSSLPIYFKHLRSKIAFILPEPDWKDNKFPKDTKVNTISPYFNKDSTSVQVIYDRVKEGISPKNGVIQFYVQINDVQGINCLFSFDVSNVKAGTNQTVKLIYPYF